MSKRNKNFIQSKFKSLANLLLGYRTQEGKHVHHKTCQVGKNILNIANILSKIGQKR